MSKSTNAVYKEEMDNFTNPDTEYQTLMESGKKIEAPGIPETMRQQQVDISTYKNEFTWKNKLGRLCWTIVYFLLFRPINLMYFNKWRVFLLKCFGAKMSWNAGVYASAKIWAPWNLEMEANSCLGPKVDCYNQGKISIGANTTISQKSYLCSSTHDYTDKTHRLILRPIVIEDQVWVAASAFIGPGVVIEQGAVVAACAVVVKKVDAWTVVGGNPAKFIKQRNMKP